MGPCCRAGIYNRTLMSWWVGALGLNPDSLQESISASQSDGQRRPGLPHCSSALFRIEEVMLVVAITLRSMDMFFDAIKSQPCSIAVAVILLPLRRQCCGPPSAISSKGYFDANGGKLILANADRQPQRAHTELWRTCMVSVNSLS